MTSSLVTLTIDLHDARLEIVCSIQFFGNQFTFQGLHFEEMIIEATLNFQFVSCKQLIIKCNIQLSIYIHWRFDYWLKHSIFNVFVSNNGLKIATFNFLQFEELIVVQFSIWRFEYWWQHSIFNLFVLNNGLIATTFNSLQFWCANRICYIWIWSLPVGDSND